MMRALTLREAKKAKNTIKKRPAGKKQTGKKQTKPRKAPEVPLGCSIVTKKKAPEKKQAPMKKPAAHGAEPTARAALGAQKKVIRAGSKPHAPTLGTAEGPSKTPTFVYRGALIYTSHVRQGYRVVKDSSAARGDHSYAWRKHGGREAAWKLLISDLDREKTHCK
jgi:hypothetical protein